LFSLTESLKIFSHTNWQFRTQQQEVQKLKTVTYLQKGKHHN